MAQQLTRSSDRIVAGVAGGIAKYINVDPSIVRIITALVVLFTGIGPFLYVLGWLILPEESSGKTGIDALTGGVKKAKESYDSNKVHNPNDLR
jgi:phage shock protein C